MDCHRLFLWFFWMTAQAFTRSSPEGGEGHHHVPHEGNDDRRVREHKRE